jgi:hypothetical protein
MISPWFFCTSVRHTLPRFLGVCTLNKNLIKVDTASCGNPSDEHSLNRHRNIQRRASLEV